MIKLDGEFSAELMEEIIKALPKLTSIHSSQHTILIHGMGSKPKSFYNSLRQNTDVELIWSGWCSKNVWWSHLISFIPGQAGLVRVKNRNQLGDLYLEIGGQSMCGLYFIPNNTVSSIIERLKQDGTADISDLLEIEKDYFLLIVDFDFHGGKSDGEVYYRRIIFGEALDSQIREILTLTE